jgi:thiamine-phosphate pyrophosphorylase
VCRAHGFAPLAVAEACFRGGAPWLQIRDKSDTGSGELLTLADEVTRIATRFGAQVIVNDRADICCMARCAGVHVGQEDLPVDDVRKIVGPEGIVGLSTHDRVQIDVAVASAATYVAVGPIYTTSTKHTGYEARGLELVSYAANRGKPVVAIGGITLERAAAVLRAGAYAVAVISDVLTGGDPEARTRAFLELP